MDSIGWFGILALPSILIALRRFRRWQDDDPTDGPERTGRIAAAIVAVAATILGFHVALLALLGISMLSLVGPLMSAAGVSAFGLHLDLAAEGAAGLLWIVAAWRALGRPAAAAKLLAAAAVPALTVALAGPLAMYGRPFWGALVGISLVLAVGCLLLARIEERRFRAIGAEVERRWSASHSSNPLIAPH